MTKDNLHLEDAGYAVWREALTPVVRRLIGK
jgi:lysophospholipase L1-like esterase